MVVEVAGLTNPSLLCAFHEKQLTTDFQWLRSSLPDLEAYRLNRAYGHKTGGGGNSGTAPAPLRESLSDLLYANDDLGYPGLQGTFYEWARTLKLNLPPTAKPMDLVERISQHPHLTEHAATPVYAQLTHMLVNRLKRFMADDGDAILLGPCEAIGCDGTMTTTNGDKTARCSKCGMRMPVAIIRAQLVQAVLSSEAAYTQAGLLAKAGEIGVKVNKSTLRSWIHRGQLPQAGENEESQPVYRFADLYRLATGLTGTPDIWQIINNSKEGTQQ
ncbi:hypothetical protein [Bifidobacterium olomucense]|uniref:Uncharacterized protein n=1 Tax=Bifidobacterium olomucense TaxID=2675324 RepID=A0A7Y0HW97_9BIFI|nr:hypothetical protein [Bifidobacterium sp. DSM 109959]NMM98116.1 hypothetical protein [Bifidobacterium sp. DSM 109959]